MMVLLFTLLFLATLAAWRGYRNSAIILFSFNMVLSVIWLIHHMTSQLGLQL